MSYQQVSYLDLKGHKPSRRLKMKQISSVIFIISVVSCVYSQKKYFTPGECENWPTQKQDLRECCDIPFLENSIFSRTCIDTCSTEKKEFDYVCFLACFVNETGLIINGKIDKDAVRNRYARERPDIIWSYDTDSSDGNFLSDENNFTIEATWKETVDMSIARCEYEDLDSLTKSLSKYFNCLNDHMAVNCRSFNWLDKCELVQSKLENCQDLQPDCETVKEKPYFDDSEYNGHYECCLMPLLVTERTTEKCLSDCDEKEMFEFRRRRCNENCTFVDTGLVTSDGSVDFEKAKEILLENSGNPEKWEKSIEKAVKKCRASLEG